MSTTAELICRVIASARYDLSNEKGTQSDMHKLLVSYFGDQVRREHRLGDGDIPDFMIGDVVVEVKIKGAVKRSVFRQLERYAAYPDVKAVVLASSLAMGLPDTINGKPAWFVSLGRGWL